MTQQPLAVLADIHGNAWALRAVLADAKTRGITRFANLGDTFYGPLDPQGTRDILRNNPMPTVLGNQDRILLEGGPEWADNPHFKAALAGIGPEGLAWLRSLPAMLRLDDSVLLCHGTPRHDAKYLLEDVTTGLPTMRPCEAVREDLLPEADGCTLILAGHSHHPGRLDCPPFTVVNPGSVGLPAYDDDTPPHAMASGTPHARYAIASPAGNQWDVQFISVTYDWQAAAARARQNSREDWARWLTSGKA
ncbi:metallophosphoesterase family protein [Pseudodesulfovibrio sp.]|uniref:metallophosphoesterase family protein n=1 Tax=unclassified Pseudodesulfovibrio TaxID=2661612 RepID=UPI003B0005B4